MRRVGLGLATIAILHIPVRGPGIDYLGVLAASLASWAGLPGPGEAALVAAGISAGDHNLDISALIAVAWVGATAGGMAGWLVGVRAGRNVLTAPGPLYRLRVTLIERGERFYDRYGLVAVFFTPSWIAGIHNMRLSRYAPANAVSALLWALGWGLAGYYVGPSIGDVIGDAGSARWLILIAVVAAVTAIALIRRRRARRR
ncbi:MAG TPA: DedA family protein [Solirubrobacteraceae bacterium]|nr:DedA family protein [Solirubrobacteraceae bacterium]